MHGTNVKNMKCSFRGDFLNVDYVHGVHSPRQCVRPTGVLRLVE